MKRNKPIISVIIPLYNKEMFIEECLRSIQNQTFRDWECIIIDDGSTDGSEEIALKVIGSDSRFSFYSQINAGPSAARNTGIKRAAGQYVEFVDADDVVDVNLLQRQLTLATDEGSDVVICPLIQYNEQMDQIKFKQNMPTDSTFTLDSLKSDDRFITDQLPSGPYAKLIKKEMLSKNKIAFSEKTNIGEDQVFSLQVYISANSISVISDALYYYRFNSGGLMSNVSKHPTDIVQAYREMKDILETSGLYEQWKSSFLKYFNANVKYNISFFGSDARARKELKIASTNFLRNLEPAVSIIIPMFNTNKRFLVECLESIRGQTEKNWECIIVDDGSTDGSLEVANNFIHNDSRFSIIQQRNSGPSIARNAGILKAKGELIHFMDSDDYYPSASTLEKILNIYMQKKPDAISGNLGIQHEDGEINYNLETKVEKVEYKKFSDVQNDYFFSRFFFRREFILQKNIRFPEYTYVGEDPVFLVKALSSMKQFLVTDLPVYVYRRTEGGNSDFMRYSDDRILGYMMAQLEVLGIAKSRSYKLLTRALLDRINNDLLDTYNEKSKNNIQIREKLDLMRSFMPLVTVIIPVYNTQKRFLLKCLKSVEDQAYLNIEVIIVDDGSGDETAVLLDEYGSRQGWRVLHQINQGLSAARNSGYEIAKGRYVQFLDSDDYFDKQLIRSTVEIAESSGADVVIENFMVLNYKTGEEHTVLTKTQFPSSDTFELSDLRGGKFNTIPYNVWSKLFRKAFLDRHLIFHDQELARAEDVLFSYSALLKTRKIAFNPIPYIYYREDLPGSNSKTNDSHPSISVRAWEKLYNIFIEDHAFSQFVDDYETAMLDSLNWHFERLHTNQGRIELASSARVFLDKYKFKKVHGFRLVMEATLASPSLLVLLKEKDKQVDILNQQLQESTNRIMELESANYNLERPSIKRAGRKLVGSVRRRVKRSFS